jgi:hypothetical protein
VLERKRPAAAATAAALRARASEQRVRLTLALSPLCLAPLSIQRPALFSRTLVRQHLADTQHTLDTDKQSLEHGICRLAARCSLPAAPRLCSSSACPPSLPPPSLHCCLPPLRPRAHHVPTRSRSALLSPMSLPAQKCDLSREELKDDGNKLNDICPACKELGASVKVMFHKAHAAAPAAAAGPRSCPPWTHCLRTLPLYPRGPLTATQPLLLVLRLLLLLPPPLLLSNSCLWSSFASSLRLKQWSVGAAQMVQPEPG